jgi:hypothetical protein
VALWEKVETPNKTEYIDWDAGREGYLSSTPRYTPVVAPKAVQRPKGESNFLSVRAEERLGSLIASAGTIWAVYVATVDYSSLWHMRIMPPGPVEICALGILAWLHAKLRRSTKA